MHVSVYAHIMLWSFIHIQKAQDDHFTTLEDFEKKLMETDAYLQLLIEQNEVSMLSWCSFFF